MPNPSFSDVEDLELALSEPTPAVVEMFRQLQGDLLILGVGGKMGPTLARMAQRANEMAGTKRRLIGVSRFGSGDLQQRLNHWGIETIAADLLDERQLRELPDAPNIVYMAGMKFGASGNEPLTWAMNSYLPGMICRRYPKSRIAAFSTGNIYGLLPITRGGSIESDPLNPTGDYAMSCLGRERIFEHFAKTNPQPISIIRLNYACELRYGVLVDMARKVWAGQPIDLAMGNFNVIWQGDANAMSLLTLSTAASPAFALNVAGPEIMSVRRVCEQFSQLMNKPVEFVGTEAPDALLSNGQLGHHLFGYPRIGAQQMIQWVADWIMRGGADLGKPTHFETRDGKF
ncbi:MAG: NAD-dependent epimerase/dehydratase family protein [Phycisphaerales bacterium]|nr:NAD-dependent epimerase/dehydratase family protein [Phycisphaerales bacterium]